MGHAENDQRDLLERRAKHRFINLKPTSHCPTRLTETYVYKSS